MPSMLLKRAATVFVVLGLVALVLYSTNATPVVPTVPPDDVADLSRPFVVKLHAQWCPKCMVQKGIWAGLERDYGDRVNLVVLDFTTDRTTAASREAARRIGLEPVFDSYDGVTGAALVVDGRTREVVADVAGFSADDYRAAIDTVLAR
jgi:thiol-disulfide isomerase/thioredoxin